MPKETLITCCKCHGKGIVESPIYFADGVAIGLAREECLLCHGTGKITLEFYEELQKRVREK